MSQLFPQSEESLEARRQHARNLGFKRCVRCMFYGAPVGFNGLRGKYKREIHECTIHKGCFNTELSYACKDFMR